MMQIDVEQLHKLLELMKEHGVTELEAHEGEASLHLRRGADPAALAAGPGLADLLARAQLAAPAPAAAPATATPAAAAPAAPSGPKPLEVKSPMVGTFYTASSPDAPAFVQVGDRVDAQTTVCIIEAMKVMNEVKAGVSGKVAKVVAANGKPVEYGQVLFLVEAD